MLKRFVKKIDLNSNVKKVDSYNEAWFYINNL